jgi:hypothetical protein
MPNREMIPCSVELALVRRLRWPVSGGVVSAGEDTIYAILVQDIRVKEYAETGIRGWHSVSEVVSGLLKTRSCTHRGVVRLRHREGLHAHIGSGSCGRADSCVVQKGGTSPAWKGLGVGCVGARV